MSIIELAACWKVSAIHGLLWGHHDQPVGVGNHLFACLLGIVQLPREFEWGGVVLWVGCTGHVQWLHFWILFVTHRTICWGNMCMLVVRRYWLIASVGRLWAIFKNHLLVCRLTWQCSFIYLLTVLRVAGFSSFPWDNASTKSTLDHFSTWVLPLRALSQSFEFWLDAGLDLLKWVLLWR